MDGMDGRRGFGLVCGYFGFGFMYILYPPPALVFADLWGCLLGVLEFGGMKLMVLGAVGCCIVYVYALGLIIEYQIL